MPKSLSVTEATMKGYATWGVKNWSTHEINTKVAMQEN